jgi:glycosyltransferase involved in cell wall biosynthesis
MKKSDSVNNPLVSIIMPVYNAEKYLDASIQSILQQTYEHIELLIVDDRSSDSSWKIIQSYQKKYPSKVRALRPRTNLNKEGDACVNYAMKYAKGEYGARMDADDIAYPKRIERQVKFLEKNPDVFMVGGQASLIDKNGTKTGVKHVPTSIDAIRERFFQVHPIIHPTIMFRNESPGKPFYQLKFDDSNDYYTFFTFIMQGKKIANVPVEVLQYRIHGENSTVRKMKSKLITTIRVREEMMKVYGYKPSFIQYVSYLVQYAIAMFVPESLLIQMYYITQKNIRLSEIISNWIKKGAFWKSQPAVPRVRTSISHS